jgi:hypothetical protein
MCVYRERLGGHDCRRPDACDLAVRISATWVAFAGTGHRTMPRIPFCPPYTSQDRATTTLDTACRVAHDSDRDARLLILLRPATAPVQAPQCARPPAGGLHPITSKSNGSSLAHPRSLKAIVHFYNTRDVLPRCQPHDVNEGATCWPAPESPASRRIAYTIIDVLT